ncbi:putative ubiquitin carboxyl-terminal hydrolase MINDY-4 isoform X2 [Genypterus blacodes]|uniref:putative ubiquitin carboxyl-terminal hydrolase MINDY-4 isoform X2 n=1 Tax=Genypterus blacodes TaxID=154954 RepID=UPI003F770F34
MVVSVEEVSSSLVREYLSRKGLKRTIACMDEEHPRTEASINNRSELRQVLHMESLYRKNKTQKTPLKTLLEIMVKHHLQEYKNNKSSWEDSDPLHSAATLSLSAACNSPRMIDSSEDNAAAFVNSKSTKLRSLIDEASSSQPTLSFFETERLSAHNQASSWISDHENHKGHPPLVSLQDNEIFTTSEPERKTVITESSLKSRTNRIRRGVMAGPIASTLQESNKKRQTRRSEVPLPQLRKEEEIKNLSDGLSVISLPSHLTDYMGARWELMSTPEREKSEETFTKSGKSTQKTRNLKSLASPNAADLCVSEMVLDDVDDEDDWQQLSKVSFQTSIPTRSYASLPMDQHTATELKEVLFGSSRTCFSFEWRNQGFTFSETHDLRYGIVQRKGGPCGVLASIQGFFLKNLLFENIESSNTGLQRLRPSNTTRRKCLVLAMAEILWRAGEEKQATLAISGRNHFIPTGHYKSEGLLEKITCFTVDDIKDLQLVLEQHVEQFESGVLACVLLTISAVLSRSVPKVRGDMDVPTNTLIGAHGYCTQELVNLLLCGRAVSNVFDNDVELDSGNGNTTLLKGVKSHCDIGLLSLFEHYNICKVGAYLKDPQFPIWVVCSESHFSVLFGLQMELLTNEDQVLEFDLYYYDGLANQQEEIRLTISVGVSALSSQDVHPDLTPPLEHCIRTRWKDAVVSWNDTEPIL